MAGKHFDVEGREISDWQGYYENSNGHLVHLYPTGEDKNNPLLKWFEIDADDDSITHLQIEAIAEAIKKDDF